MILSVRLAGRYLIVATRNSPSAESSLGSFLATCTHCTDRLRESNTAEQPERLTLDKEFRDQIVVAQIAAANFHANQGRRHAPLLGLDICAVYFEVDYLRVLQEYHGQQ
jgi:hypothetical protein